ncbi:MAG: hypothetical protein QHH06_10455 [Clostridiales bacterium]|nr:hypothetical protein [Eubacteriales bacterium]MDH7566887.1 hypothetical protein [Clostridiales bacterium]
MKSEVRVFIRHNVDPALLDILEKVETTAGLEICGPEVILYDVDMEKLMEDINKVGRQAEYINRIYEQAGYPWIAREVLEGKAVIINDRLVYLPGKGPKTLREKLELIVGPLTDTQFKQVMDITTEDIRFNLLSFGHKADIDTIVKIAAQCYEALKRCGE